MRSVSTSSWQKDARCTTEQVKNLLHSLLWWIINQSCFFFFSPDAEEAKVLLCYSNGSDSY